MSTIVFGLPKTIAKRMRVWYNNREFTGEGAREVPFEKKETEKSRFFDVYVAELPERDVGEAFDCASRQQKVDDQHENENVQGVV